MYHEILFDNSRFIFLGTEVVCMDVLFCVGFSELPYLPLLTLFHSLICELCADHVEKRADRLAEMWIDNAADKNDVDTGVYPDQKERDGSKAAVEGIIDIAAAAVGCAIVWLAPVALYPTVVEALKSTYAVVVVNASASPL